MPERISSTQDGVQAALVSQVIDAIQRAVALEQEMRASRRRFRIGMAWRLALMAAVILGMLGNVDW